jgi:23S rRNA pseudouridine1911/1915/1917 synthase
MEYAVAKDILILNFLQELFPESSSNTLRSWLRAGRVLANDNVIIKANTPLAKGTTVSIGPKVSFLRKGIKVLFEDETLIVLEKPEGLLSVATDFDNSSSVHEVLKRRFHKQRVFPVHRLDRETSGVMIFAFSEKAQKSLKKQFEEKTIQKVYYALVEGKPISEKGTWESYLEEDPFYSVSSTDVPGKGKQAITHYELVSSNPRYSLLRLSPVTGKKHQLRVHCKEAGHPIIGDPRYGTGYNPIDRLGLHAQKITFAHPITEKQMCFEVPLPASFSIVNP